jgi:hypothetical protein
MKSGWKLSAMRRRGSLHTRLGVAIDGAVGAQADETGDLPDQVHQLVHRTAAQPLEPELVAFFAVLEEPAVARLILREKAAHLLDHRVFVLAHAEGGAIAPADFVIGIDGAQIDVRVEIAPAFGPELAEHLRHGHDGGAQIEPMPVLRDRRSAPARPGPAGREASPGSPWRPAAWPPTNRPGPAPITMAREGWDDEEWSFISCPVVSSLIYNMA